MDRLAKTPEAALVRSALVITGLGVISPVGKNPAELFESIRLARGGISEIRAFDTSGLRVKHAAEIRDYDPLLHFTAQEVGHLDRTAQFAIIAARQACADAALTPEQLVTGRVALVMGVCAGGQGNSNDWLSVQSGEADPRQLRRFFGTAHYYQTDAVAADLKLHGPVLTVSTACASSTSALAIGFSLLQSGRCDAVLVGGADAFSLYTYAGFYALGAMPEKPISPFSVDTGVTFGEGAGFVVLERHMDALKRQARCYGELFGFGMTSDAHHITAPHPSGEGLCRAMRTALRHAGIEPNDLDYINAHGTGTQDNDVSETLAIRGLFSEGARIPPVSSSKSFFGHTLGAAGILEFIVSLLGHQHALIPPTLNFLAARPGCNLDYVPNKPLPGRVDRFLSNSAAFGGVNAVVVGGRIGSGTRPALLCDTIGITGVGLVTPLGFHADEVVTALRAGRSAIVHNDRFPCLGRCGQHAALIRDFRARRLAPTIDVRRMDSLTQYAVVAAALALKDAGLINRRMLPERIGLVVALTRGPVSTQEQFLQSLSRDGIERLSAKHFPSMVLSTLSGQVSQSCQLKGSNFTIVDGPTAGLHALVHAYEHLRQNDELDAMVLVAADEIGSLFHQLFDSLGMLSFTDDSRSLPRLYDPSADGIVLGEGAAAIVLERDVSSRMRRAERYARIKGYGLSADAMTGLGIDRDGRWLEMAARLAIEEAEVAPHEIDVIYGHGRGAVAYDLRELQVVQRMLEGRDTPIGCVNGNFGLAEASSGLYSVVTSLLGMQRGEVYPVVSGGPLPNIIPFVRGTTRHGDFRRSLVMGSTEDGNNAAVVLERGERAVGP